MLWLTILMLLPYWVLSKNYYCSICQDHTMCKFQGSGAACGSNKVSGVSHAEIQQILTVHNYFRSKVAHGREREGYPGPQPPAANMQELVWDPSLAAVAQKWADQCIFQHDTCRNDHRFFVGQNMYFGSGYRTVDWTRTISAWYSEVAAFSPQLVDSYNFGMQYGHYSQIVWAATRYVGCGRVSYGGAYRLPGFKRTQYVLSAAPSLNESLLNDEITYERRTDIPPDHEEATNTTPSLMDEEKEQTTELSTTNQPSEDKNTEENITDNPAGNNSSVELKEEEIQPNQSTPSQSPAFSIYIPGYWIAKSKPRPDGRIAGVFQSLDFTGTADLNQFIQETPSNRAWEKSASDPSRRSWNYFAFDGLYNQPSTFQRQDRGPIQPGTFNNNGWIGDYYQDVGNDQILVCNYGPTGNYLYQPVYIRGEPCSNCPAGAKCRNGLCSLPTEQYGQI